MSHPSRSSARCALPLALLSLILATAPASAQTPSGNRTVSGTPSASPCDVLASGGTVFDTSECEVFLATGIVRGAQQWIARAGHPLDLRLVSRNPRAALRSAPVVLVRPGERTPVAQARTGRDGTFRLSLPASLTGEFQIVSPGGGNAEPAEILVCDGNGNCFEFCTLPSEPTTMTPICVEDPPLRPMMRVVPAGPRRR